MLIKKSIKLLLVSAILAITIASLAYGDDPAKELREKGFKASTEGRYEEAIKLYRKILTSYPNSEYADDAQWGIISVYSYGFHDDEKQYTECQNLLKNYPNSRWDEQAMRVMANITFNHKKDYQKAIELSRRFLETYPNSQFAFEQKFQIAWAYKYLNQYEAAIREAKEMISGYPNHTDTPGLYNFIGSTYFYDLGDVKNAEKAFKEMLEKYPNSPESFQALQSLASVYQRQNKWEDAQQLYKAFLKEHPDHKDTQKIKKYLKLTEERVRLNTN